MRFLVASADPALGLLLEQLVIRSGGDVSAVEDGTEAWKRLEGTEEPVVILADAALPSIDGASLCERLRQTPEASSYYFVLVVSSPEGFDLDRASHCGVDDIIVRPFHETVLDLRVRAALTILSLRAEAQAARDAVRAHSTTDPVTGALNRTAIRQVIDRELSRASRDATPVAVLSILIDDFRHMFEWHGEETGREVIAEACRRVQRLLRPYDGLGRDGDDHLLAVLPMCDTSRASLVAARVMRGVGSEPIQTRVRAFSITLSVGIAVGGAANSHPVDDVGAAAQAAARQARDAGGNRVAIWSSGEPAA